MAQTNLNKEDVRYDKGNAGIVVISVLETVVGGRSLNVDDFTLKHIQEGHLIIRNKANGEYKPMPMNANKDAYGTLPSNHEYVGVAISTILTEKPMCAIMTRGRVNKAAAPFVYTEAAMTALPHITFVED